MTVYLPIAVGFRRFERAPATVAFNAQGIRVKYQSGPAVVHPEKLPEGFVDVIIPLKVDGLPPATLLRGSGLLSLTADNAAWLSRAGAVGASVIRAKGQYWENFKMLRGDFDRIESQAIR